MIFNSQSLRETKKLAEQFVKKALKMRTSKAIVFALEGELGAGKTAFSQGFAHALGIKRKIKSPTFALMKSYALEVGEFKQLYHIDCYRLKDYKDLILLGAKEIFTQNGNIILIEWADRIKKIIPKNAIWLHFDHIDLNKRKIRIKE
jgi:tRNA threonylcarbamoyladenosine biosynthesis protein TsaE